MKLKAKKRDVTGKAVKNLRGEGSLPAVVYGPSTKSQNILLDGKEFNQLEKEVEGSAIFDLEIDGEKKPVKVLIKEVQSDPVADQVLHVSLFQIDPGKEITIPVSIEIRGESPAVKNNIGFLVNPVTEIMVRCLPKDIPEKLVVDVSNLIEIGNSIKVDEIQLDENVKYSSKVDQKTSLVYIAPPQKEIVEEVVEEVDEEAEEVEGEEVEGEEGEEPKAEGEEKEVEPKEEKTEA